MFNLNQKNYFISFLLIGIFLLALFLRFLYFPQNIYFGFDQARDAFVSQQILKGDLKIVGPPTGVDGWFHGPLYYYIWAPIYFFSSGNPEAVAAFLRIVNAAGIFLVFAIGTVLFNKWTGVASAFLFAVSFEQSQYALYFNHPSLAVISVMIFYLGLSLLFFKKYKNGLIPALLGLGLSLQFEFVLMYLFLVFTILMLAFKKHLPPLDKKVLLLSSGGFLLTISTFLLSEIKFHFRSVSTLASLLPLVFGHTIGVAGYCQNIYLISQRFISDNFVSQEYLTCVLLVLLLIIVFARLFTKSEFRERLLFLLIWFFAGMLPYLNNKSATPLYYYSVASSVSLLIFVGFLINKVFQKSKIAAVLLLFIPLLSNMNLIMTYNNTGSIPTINVQSGMLLVDEEKIVDYIYQNAAGEKFAINGLTMPFFVNTTWSYLFQWYGLKRYHYLPVWGGQAAEGYPGNLKVITARSALPDKQYLIIEPDRGIRLPLVENFLREENYFSKVIKEEKIGNFLVQSREPI